MRSLAIVGAFAASSVVFALGFAGAPAWSLAPCSAIGWVSLVWCAFLVFAGSGARAWNTAASVAALLPWIALGAGTDLRAGDAVPAVLAHALSALASFAAWSFAMERSARSARGARFARAAFGVVALGLPALAAAVTWGSADELARAPVWLVSAASASPLAWSWGLAAHALGAGWRALPFAPLGAAAGLTAIAVGLERKGRAR